MQAMVLESLAGAGPGQLIIIESTINFTIYQRVLEKNAGPYLKKM